MSYYSRTTQSTFSNNTDDDCRCTGFGSSSHQMSECNIIRNNQLSTNEGYLHNSDAQTTLSGCVIHMNTGANNDIYVLSGNVTLNNCYIQSDNPTYGNVIIQSPCNLSQTLYYIHFTSHYCIHKTPSPPRTLLPTPSQIPPRTLLPTPPRTLLPTPSQSPPRTLLPTPSQSPTRTIILTPFSSPLESLIQTYLSTPSFPNWGDFFNNDRSILVIIYFYLYLLADEGF